ncbi:MAG: hypothetical protein EOO53_12235 [Gammaproteobacteria bacterium]|nr:MAG: hypothetical protein EOO53_12235 [Gammaproteobacteria bacterium]
MQITNYIKHPIEEFNNNPLTESLQVIETKVEITQLLTRVPTTDIDNLSSFYRNARIGQLRNLHIPHHCSEFMYHKIMELILCGYSTKNPLDSKMTRAMYSVANSAKDKNYLTNGVPELTTAPSCLAHGPSGSSKSTTIRNTLSLIPQLIRHTSYNNVPFRQDQLVWISFDCAATASPKALALNFFKAVDKVLGTNYYDIWLTKNKLSVEAHFGNMQLIAITHCVGFVHIDELQFLLSYARTKDSPTLQTIEALFNKIGIPVLLTTTSAGLGLFKSTEPAMGNIPNLTTPRRMLSEHEFKFNAFSLQSDEFNRLYDALYPPGLCVGRVLPGADFKKCFHSLSAGLPAVMTRLARLNHEYIWRLAKKETGDEQFLEGIYKSQFSIINEALKHLKNGDIKGYENAVPRGKNGNPIWTNDDAKQEESEKVPKVVPSIEDESRDAPLEKGEDPLAIGVGLNDSHNKELANEK